MIELDITPDNQFVLVCPPREREYAKQVPGLKYRAAPDCYVGPANWTTATILNGVFASRGLQVSIAVQVWIATEFERVSNLVALKTSTEDHGIVVPANNGDKLFPFQANDAWFMAQAKSCIDISVLGSGKGPKSISAIRLAESVGEDVYPLLVVTRPMMLFTFEEEVHKWLPGASTQVLTKGMTPSARKKALAAGADVVIIPWHLLSLHSRLASYGSQTLSESQKTPKELNGRFKSAIFDEAHKALDPQSQVTRAMWAVADELQYKFFLTNTPMKDAPDDLWSLLRAAYPTHFPASTRFKDRYCNMLPQFFGGDKCIGLRADTEEEFRQIFAPLHVDRGEEVLPELPTKDYHPPYLVDMESKQAKAYKDLNEKGMTKIGDLILTATEPMTKRLRLLQIAAGTPVLGLSNVKNSETGETEEKVVIESLTTPSCKTDFLLEVLDKYNEPLIVFMESRLLLDLCARVLQKEGVSFVEFKGGMKDKAREAGRHAFQSGDVRVALCMLQCAAEGLTLTAAPRTLYLQRSDDMVLSTQSEGRIRRIGQTAEVVEYLDCVTRGTDEMRVHENYLEKEGRSHAALGRATEQRDISA